MKLRLRTATAVAAVGHVLLASPLFVRHDAAPAPASQEPPREIKLDELPIAPSMQPLAESDGPLARIASAREIGRSSPAPAHGGPSREAPAPPSITEAANTYAFDPIVHEPIARSAVDLGLGSRWKSVLPAPSDTAARAVDRSLRSALDSQDTSRGLGHASALVSAVRAAAAATDAPDVGTTTLEIDYDAKGAVVAARADNGAWAEVAKAVVRGLAGKPLRVPHGSRGRRARLQVVAERGEHGTTSPGAVPDDVAGSGSVACVGEGLARRCNAGMPLGLTSSNHDTANAGVKTARVVHVRVLDDVEI